MSEVTQPAVVVRVGRVADIPAIAHILETGGARSSIPVRAYMGLDWGRASTWAENRHWVVEGPGIILGHFFLYEMDPQDQWVELVSLFSPLLDSAGICEAFHRLFEVLFSRLNIHKISLLVDPDNSVFFTIACHLQMLLEGTLRHRLCVNGTRYDISLFSRMAEGGEEYGLEQKQRLLSQLDRLGWMQSQARHDGMTALIVRAVLLEMAEKDIKMVLVKKDGFEEAPGGRVLAGESLHQAIQRTVREDTGLEVSGEVHYLTRFDFTSEDNERVREFVFRVTTQGPIDAKRSILVSLQDLHKTKLHPELIQVLTSYSPVLSYETKGCPIHEHGATIDLLRPPSQQLSEALISGHHLDAYAAKGLSQIEPFGLVLRDSANRIVGGLTAEVAYGCLFVRRIWVDPDWRRVGWGKKLMARAEAIGTEWGCTFAMAFVMDWEDIPFFQKIGYSVHHQYGGFLNNSRQVCCRKELPLFDQDASPT